MPCIVALCDFLACGQVIAFLFKLGSLYLGGVYVYFVEKSHECMVYIFMVVTEEKLRNFAHNMMLKHIFPCSSLIRKAGIFSQT
jgi:uncharacterized membrane protein